METFLPAFNSSIMYLLSFKVYVLLPVIIFFLALIFRIPLSTAFRSALMLGIGFIGIFMTFDFYVSIINPAITALIQRTGLHFTVFDTGWIPLSVITWQFHLAPILLVIFILINVVMLVIKKTRTVNIDIWNFWHVIFISAAVYTVTGSNTLAILFGVGGFFLTLKLSDWSAPLINKVSGMSGICIPHLSALAYYPVGIIGNAVLDRIPLIKDLEANPEQLKRKLGLFGEPMIMGLLLAILLGIASDYSVKATAELAVSFAGVIYILPIVCNILGSALIPISDGMKTFLAKRFPDLGITFIGLDVAVLFGMPAVMVTTLLLIPVSLVLSFVLPGISFIPLGDLTNLTVPVALLVISTRGNIVRSFILGIPVVAGNLYFATALAPLFTNMARAMNYRIEGYEGVFTSFLDGGNILRGWLIQLSAGHIAAFVAIPFVILLLVITRVLSRRQGAAQS